MSHRNKINILSVAVLSFFFIGCEKNEVTNSDIMNAIENLVDDDSEFSLDEFFEGEALADEFTGSGLNKVTNSTKIDNFPRFRFGREVTSVNRTIEHEFDSDTVVISTINIEIIGIFHVEILDSTGNVETTFDKPFDQTAIRKIKSVKVDDSGRPRRDWKIVGMTPIVATSGDNIGIQTLQVLNSSTGEVIISFDANTILDTFLNREMITDVAEGDSITWSATITNLEDTSETNEGVWIRSGAGSRQHSSNHHHRFRLFDDGTHDCDEVANDNVYTRCKRIHPIGGNDECRKFKTFCDVIDLQTLLDPTTDYHSTWWGFPYRVCR